MTGWYYMRGLFWFRLFGWGLRVADRRIHPALFSERTGRIWVLRVGPWSIAGLRPWSSRD